jgi:hypothetical protein
MAANLVANNMTFFFDIHSDGVYAQYLHAVVLFSEPRGSTAYHDLMINGTRV